MPVLGSVIGNVTAEIYEDTSEGMMTAAIRASTLIYSLAVTVCANRINDFYRLLIFSDPVLHWND